VQGQGLYLHYFRSELWSKSSAPHALKQSTLAVIQLEPTSAHIVARISNMKLIHQLEMHD
jgi:hypothetical protein